MHNSTSGVDIHDVRGVKRNSLDDGHENQKTHVSISVQMYLCRTPSTPCLYKYKCVLCLLFILFKVRCSTMLNEYEWGTRVCAQSSRHQSVYNIVLFKYYNWISFHSSLGFAHALVVTCVFFFTFSFFCFLRLYANYWRWSCACSSVNVYY